MDAYNPDKSFPAPPLHHYPDPDYAAHANQYPWVREDDRPLISRSPQQPLEAWRGSVGGPLNACGQDEEQRLENDAEYSNVSIPSRVRGFFDPDFQVSDDPATEDDLFSQGSSDSFDEDVPIVFENHDLDDQHKGRAGLTEYADGALTIASRGSGRRNRPRGIGRGGKGIKRGMRKPVEPAPEFKALHSEATMAFIEGKFDEAEGLTLRAINWNPEMFEAHSLLSQIHYACGDKSKAITAAFGGALTRPRDTKLWTRLARDIMDNISDLSSWTIDHAIECCTRVIDVDKTNFGVRYHRAALNRELGYSRKAAAEYEQMLKQSPHDATVLRHLADVYIDLDEAERALRHYEATFAYIRIIEPVTAVSFTWSDVNIVAELFWYLQQFDKAINKVRSLSRWLLGRGTEEFWDAFELDDREWDAKDQPRRCETPGFVPDVHQSSSYGEGLPLELRIKLGLFRLHSPKHDLSEAIRHFEWLNPGDDQSGASLFDYPDLFREVGNALREQQHYEEALEFYEPLQKITEYADASFLMELASCYRALGKKIGAEDCYKAIIENDGDDGQAELELAAMQKANEHIQTSVTDAIDTRSDAGQKRTIYHEKRVCRMKDASSTDQPSRLARLARRPTRQTAKRSAPKKEQPQEDEIFDLFVRRQSIAEELAGNSEAAEAAWNDASRKLLHAFQENRVFFPSDKHHKFYGYTKEARSLASKPKYQIDLLIDSPPTTIGAADGEEIPVPTTYCGISFSEWLDIFLEYSVSTARNGNIKTAYDTLSSALNANIYHHSPDALFSIHVCWFTCALLGNDDETLCNTARWFIKEYQFVTDGYRLFSALNRLCDTENTWFNSGPSQKYILRQLKTIDSSLKRNVSGKGLVRIHDDSVKAQEMDVGLLMLYGHVLYAGRSYAYAVNYFLRALALDAANSMIKFSLALGYIHWALKRQAENRHHILIQGFAFLQEYYNTRLDSDSLERKQEAEYNVARTYHLLGLTHLAIPYYERCLAWGGVLLGEMQGGEADKFCCEAALALQHIWAAGGNLEQAMEVTEDWLCL